MLRARSHEQRCICHRQVGQADSEAKGLTTVARMKQFIANRERCRQELQQRWQQQQRVVEKNALKNLEAKGTLAAQADIEKQRLDIHKRELRAQVLPPLLDWPLN